MPYFTTSLTTAASSIPGASTAANLNWQGGRMATAAVYPSTTGTSSASFRIEYTLDDLTVTKSSFVLWSGVSSGWNGQGVYTSTSATIFGASAVDATGVFTTTFLGPVAGVRINSTGLSSGPLILKILQGEGG